MDPTKQNKEGVERCLERVRKENPEVGVYLEHAVAPSRDSEFVVRVSNGRLNIPIAIAKDFCEDPDSVHPQIINQITDSFRHL